MRDPAQPERTQRSIARIEAMLRGDGALEPPPDALSRAMALRVRVAARRAGRPALLAKLGDVMDLAGARLVEWLGLASGPAAAGIRDDRGAEIVDAAIAGTDLVLVAERTVGEDAMVRLVGEFRRASGGAVRGRIAVLDSDNRVLGDGELDRFGMFAVPLSGDARRIAFLERGDAAREPVVIELGDRSRGNT